MSNCGCEGSCPVCRLGEVDDHVCNHCGVKFCPKCHGALSRAAGIKLCFCPPMGIGSQVAAYAIRQVADQDLRAALDQVAPRKGDWMQTYTGKVFWPLDPRAEEVNIEDIAHSLSLQCRFAGHCRFHYSVAQHSVLVAQSLRLKEYVPAVVVWGLLHDAPEAYVVDLPRPVKTVVQGYREAENTVLGVIAEHFSLTLPIPETVHLADNEALATEKRDVMVPCEREWQPLPDPWLNQIAAWQPREAERAFLEMAVRLGLRGAGYALQFMG